MTLLITGDTYLIRRDLAQLGCVFSYEHNWYVGNIDSSQLSNFDVEIEEIEHIDINEEFIVNQKRKRAENKANKWNNKADKHYTNWENSKLSSWEREFLSLMEPVKLWHHSAGRHTRLLEKADRDLDRRMNEYKEWRMAESKAKYWENKTYYTEEEKKQRKELANNCLELAIKLWKENHKVGDVFECFTANQITIKKINKKTITSEWWSTWDIKYAKDINDYYKKAREIILSWLNEND